MTRGAFAPTTCTAPWAGRRLRSPARTDRDEPCSSRGDGHPTPQPTAGEVADTLAVTVLRCRTLTVRQLAVSVDAPREVIGEALRSLAAGDRIAVWRNPISRCVIVGTIEARPDSAVACIDLLAELRRS